MLKENEGNLSDPDDKKDSDLERRLARTVFKSKNFGKEPDVKELQEIMAGFNEAEKKQVFETEKELDELYDQEKADKEEGIRENELAIKRLEAELEEKILEYDSMEKELGLGPFLQGFLWMGLATSNKVLKLLSLGKVNFGGEDLELMRKIHEVGTEIWVLHEIIKKRKEEFK